MIEIRLHGRGGQGVKKASQILGRAGFLAGYYVQDFALYGAERKGAPLTSFVRLSKKPIRIIWINNLHINVIIYDYVYIQINPPYSI